MQEHDMIRRRVNQWQDRMTPLAARLAPVQPPARVWASLAQRLALPGAKPQAAGWWHSLAFWRGFGGVAAALALGLAVVLSYRLEAPAPATPVAVIEGEGGARLIASLDSRGELHIAGVGPVAAPSARDLELWALPEGGKPVSLGVMHLQPEARLALNDGQRTALAHSAALAVSVEPVGGSPTGQPTGPVVMTGKLNLPVGKA
jgi:anti-sigma-K factor RskA